MGAGNQCNILNGAISCLRTVYVYLFDQIVAEGDVDNAGEESSEARQGGHLVVVEGEDFEFFVVRPEVLDQDVHRTQLKRREVTHSSVTVSVHQGIKV